MGHCEGFSREPETGRSAVLQIPLYAAGAGYFLILSLFPALVVLLGLLRLTTLDVESLGKLLAGILPETLLPAAREFIRNADRHFSGSMVGLSALTTLWSAGKGIYGLMLGLNRVYRVRETRNWLLTRVICTAYTFAFLLILLLTLMLQVFGNVLAAGLSSRVPEPLRRFLTSVLLRGCLLVALQTGFFCLMYRVLPNRSPGFRENLPGALLACAGWLLFSDLYSLYTESFAGLRGVYGSVYALALGMLWLHCCLSILFYGGALNHWLQTSGEKPVFFGKMD